MDKNIYEIIKDWHELFQNGIITEEEFIAKKKELLETEIPKVNVIENEPLTITENLNHSQYNSYEEIYEEESFVSKYKLLIILMK